MKINAMKSVKMLLLAALLVQPLAAGAKFAVIVTSPKRNAKLTNEMITATGVVKSSLPVTAVYYSFNGSDWALASGTTNWSVPDLSLTAGANTFWVYATDTGPVPSATNKVAFTYVVMQPVTIEINGHGKVSPDYSDKLLQIGRTYKANAKADKGFAFSGWTGDITNAGAHLKFMMQSNLTLVANFVDVAPPRLSITLPVAGQIVSNSPITPKALALDNVGVTAVYYQFNGGAWQSDASSTDGTNWTFAALDLTPGANTLRAYATDEAGNISTTNTVAFTYSVPPFTGFAPETLSGMVGEIVEDGYPTVQVSFGTSTVTFSTTDTNAAGYMAAGNYSCTPTGSNTVRLAVMLVSPPTQAGTSWFQELEFTNENTCVLSNLSNGTLASTTLTAAPKLVPSGSAILTVQHWVNGEIGTGTSVMGSGVFTNYSDFGTPAQAANSWGTNYTFSYSPVTAMMQEYFTDPNDAGSSSYTLLTFASATNGTWAGVSFDADLNPTWSGTGGFQILSTANPPAGYAPMDITGKVVTVTEGGASFKVCFGDSTFTIFDANTNHENSSVNNYNYYKTGPNTANLVNLTVMPPYEGSLTDISIVHLNFTSATKGNVQTENGTSSFTIAAANNYAPASLVGKTITVKQGGITMGSGTFNQDGTFTFTMSGGSPDTMIYDYAPFSPQGGMFVLWHNDGSTSYLQIQFNNATSGSWYETDYDSLGVLQSVYSGTFTVN